MEIVTLVCLIAAVGAFVLFQRERGVVGGLQESQDELKTELSGIKQKLKEGLKERDDFKDKVVRIQADLKKAKQRIHQLNTNKNLTKGKGKGTKSGASTGLAAVRTQLGDALQDVDILKTRVSELQAKLNEAQHQDEPSDTVTAPGEPGASRADIRALEREWKQEFRERLDETRKEAALKRSNLADEVHDVKRRLNRALQKLDTERGRSENNEKAYHITKTQLESALDRLHEFDPSVPRPFKVPLRAEKDEGAKEQTRSTDLPGDTVAAFGPEDFETADEEAGQAEVEAADEKKPEAADEKKPEAADEKKTDEAAKAASAEL
jgi:predicted nuclease with TOPRIM domain